MSKDENFEELEKALICFVDELEEYDVLNAVRNKDEQVLELLNTSEYMLTLHDVEFYKPVCINEAMKDFYGFKRNWFVGIDYVYYLNTLHHSTYNSLIESMAFFKLDKNEFLYLKYKLRFKNKKWVDVVGVTKTIARKKNGKPKYALSFLMECKSNQNGNKNPLTAREMEVSKWLVQGLKRKDVAEKMNLSKHTVDTHVKKIYTKTGVTKVTELIFWLEHHNSNS